MEDKSLGRLWLEYLVWLVAYGGSLVFLIFVWAWFGELVGLAAIAACGYLWYLWGRRGKKECEVRKGEHKAEYQSYLQSRHWKETRYDAKARAGRRCERCGSTHDLQVHHLTYARKGFERPEDLEVLCKRCHYIVHERQN